MVIKDETILIISNEPWGPVWYSKHNYAYELSKLNKVIFINPPKKWGIKNLFKGRVETIEINNNLSAINYLNFLPSLNKIFFQVNNLVVSHRIKKYLIKNNFTDNIFWTFDPYRLVIPSKLNSSLSIFHIVDLYNHKHWGEKTISKQVDFCIYVSSEIRSNYFIKDKKHLVTQHSISSEEFTASFKPDDIPDIPYGLYIGNIDKRLDSEIIEKIALSFPAIPLVFIGQINETNNPSFQRLFIDRKYSNIILLGVRNFKDLKNYIYYSDFCIAFMEKYDGNRISHHKIYQYLAMGKPVFCSVFTAYIEIENILYMSDEVDINLQQLNEYFMNNESEDVKMERILFAQQNTFEKTLNKIGEFIYD